MNRLLFFWATFLCWPLLLTGQKVIALKIDGTINPVTADFIHRGIEKASTEKAACLLIQLNTPGGLLKSTRVIVSDMLTSPVPIVVYVSPGGAHAGSAGVFITLAAQVAAMAPGTNIGAAHPVDMQGERDSLMNEKATNDAAAFIRTIAEKRKRNLAWAEEAVRKSLSITENEALEKNVIDLVAKSREELLDRIDGKIIETGSGTRMLHTRNAQIETMEMGPAEKILDMLSDPNIAYLLLLLGLYGILFELYNPGTILPGMVGAISLVLAFYSMHTLPVNYAGVALIIFAIIFFVLEIKIASHGLLAIGGTLSLLLGSLMLIQTESALELARISRGVIIPSVATTALFFIFVLGLGLKAQRRKPVSGAEGMTGEIGESIDTLNPTGRVKVHGEIWQAEALTEKIERGEKIRVVEVKNLKLRVEHLIHSP